MTREKPICSRCNSEAITADATAYWDAFSQCWELGSAFDTYWCEDCGGETHPEWVNADTAA